MNFVNSPPIKNGAMKNFTNSVLLPENLPLVEKKTFNGLDARYLKIIYIRLAIFSLFIIGLLIAFYFLARNEILTIVFVAIISFLAIILAYSWLISVLGFPRKGYLVREKDISYQRGVITYKVTSVPFNRIQHVEVNQGVLAKIFKLSAIKIFTAGGNASDLQIPGLPIEMAQNLKTFLTDKIGDHE
jgi:hypothetical protein